MGGGGKGGGSQPSAPDYTALANQQAALNQQAAQQLTSANRPNQYDAFGNSITWNQGTPESQKYIKQLADYKALTSANIAKHSNWYAPGTVEKEISRLQGLIDANGGDKWEQHQNLTPEAKAAWDTYNKNANQASSSYGTLLNKYLSGYSGPKAYNDAEFNGKNVADALYNSVMDRARPEQQRNSAAMDTQLKQQGLIPGTESYNNAMQNLLTSQNDANNLASQNAVLAGANEGRAQYQSYLSGRNQPLQELSGMAGIASGKPYTPTYTGFSSATGYNPADLVGAAQAQQAAAQASTNSSNSKKGSSLGAGASLAGSYFGSK